MGPTGDQSADRKLTWRERYAAQPKASKCLEYRGHSVRFHLDAEACPWFVLVDIFRALETYKAAKLRKRIRDQADIKEVLAWITNTVRDWDSGFRMVQATNLSGIAAMATYRTVPNTPDFLGWAQKVTGIGVKVA